MTARYGLRIQYQLLAQQGTRTPRKTHAKSLPDPHVKTNFSTDQGGTVRPA